MGKRKITSIALLVFIALALLPRPNALHAERDGLRLELGRSKALAEHYAGLLAECLNGGALAQGAERISCRRSR